MIVAANGIEIKGQNWWTFVKNFNHLLRKKPIYAIAQILFIVKCVINV